MGNESIDVTAFDDDGKVDILYMRENRKNKKEKPTAVMFQFTPAAYRFGDRIENNEAIKKITGILDKYKVSWNAVDTVRGAFNLDREWIEAKPVDCYVEYCGVYPVDWEVKDVQTMVDLEQEGQVVVRAVWVVTNADGKKDYIPNH